MLFQLHQYNLYKSYININIVKLYVIINFINYSKTI